MKKIIVLITLCIFCIISIIYITKPEEYKTKEEINIIDKLEPLKENQEEDINIIESTPNKLEVSKQSEPEFYAEQNNIHVKITEGTQTEATMEQTISNSISNIQEESEEIQVDNTETELDASRSIQEEVILKEEIITPTEEESEKAKEVTEEPDEDTLSEEQINLKDSIYIIENKFNQLLIQEDENNISLGIETQDTNQKWKLISLGNNEYKITSTTNHDKVLQKEIDLSISLANSQELNNQIWTLKVINDGYNIISKENNLCLDTENTLQLKECIQDSDYQIFYFKDTNIEEKIYPNGLYKIKNIKDNKVIDTENTSKENGTKINITNTTSNKSQIWNITYIQDGYYKITSAMNPDIALTNNTTKEYIELQKWQDQDSQKWYLKTNIDGSISIISILNTCININASKTNTITCNEIDTQKFILEEYTEDLTYYGIDISVHQGNINWQEVAKSNVEFVIIRAGYGDNWTKQDDKKLIDNVKGCEEHNIPYGVYLYSYATNLEGASGVGESSSSVSSEISHILRLLTELKSQGYEPNLETKVFYDMEDAKTKYLGKEKLSNMAEKFCSNIENEGYNCGIYANKYWLTTYLNAISLEQKYDIWLAEWPTGVTTYEQAILHTPSYNLTNYKYWQFTSSGRIPGISGNVDLNIGYNIFG